MRLFRLVFVTLLLGILVTPCHASYYEDWVVEGKVLEVYGKEQTAEILKKNRDIQVLGMTFVGLKIRILDCVYKQGHGRVKCKKDQIRVIVLSYKPDQLKAGIEKNAVLKINYYHSNGAVPNGEEANSNLWQLAQVKAAAAPKRKEK